MKYIVFEDRTAVIFAESVSHKFIAGDRLVHSAGFCSIAVHETDFGTHVGISTYGRSDSLNKDSDGINDCHILKSVFSNDSIHIV